MNATIADNFVDTFCIIEDEKNPRTRVFIVLGELIHHKHMIEQPETYVFQEGIVHDKLILMEGGIPAVRSRLRFVKALRKCGENGPRVFILLNQIFRKEMIKMCFPDIWLAWNNVAARKKATHDRQVANYNRKQAIKRGVDLKMKHDIAVITSSRSLRQHLSDIRINRGM